MCGRFSVWSDKNTILEHFGLQYAPDFRISYNIAPSQVIPVIRTIEASRELTNCRWGLVPHWSKDSKYKPINARAESVTEKPFFRDSFRKRRCLIPANGFYEWQGPKGHKQPYYIHLKDSELFAFAGLWDRWQDQDTCAIITTTANETMNPIHDRMPVIIRQEHYDQWLEEGEKDLLRPCEMPMESYPISGIVNKPSNDGPELIKPVSSASS